MLTSDCQYVNIMIYFNLMPVNSTNQRVQEDGKEKEALVFTFTNGAREQLEELKNFLKADTELDVLKIGISLLQNFKKAKEKEQNAKSK